MQKKISIHRETRTIPGLRAGCVVTIGNFDGLHLGHQAILRRGMALGLPLVVMTFEPHPREFFSPESAPPRLSSLREKALSLQHLGVERLLCLPFRADLAHLSPEDFATRLLQRGLHAKRILVGHDFRFGEKRRGDLALLQHLGTQLGFQVEEMPPVCLDGERVSSTRVRELLAQGRLDAAQACLGHPYFMCGRVVHGDKRGRQLGFPTANIPMLARKLPMTGVFAVRAELENGEFVNAVANLGRRPTVGGLRTLLEVHLLDYDADLYGQRMRVHFLRKLRDEQRFAGLADLTRQITLDAAQARAFLEKHDSNHGL